MVKLVRVLTQKNMLEVKLDDGKQKYGNCSPEIKAYTLATFKPGDDIEIVYHDAGNLIEITAIGKPGTLKQGTPAPAAQPPVAAPAPGTTTGPVTGTAVQAPVTQAPKTTYAGKYRDAMNPDESRMVRRQSVMSSACDAVQSVICQAEGMNKPEAVAEYIIIVFNRLLSEVEK